MMNLIFFNVCYVLRLEIIEFMDFSNSMIKMPSSIRFKVLKVFGKHAMKSFELNL